MSIPIPEPEVAVALASIAMHAKEALGPDGHEFDKLAVTATLLAPGVEDYLQELDALALLPVPRSGRR